MTQHMSDHIFPTIDVRHPSPNHSSREGARCTLIVVHATAGHNIKGLTDLRGLGNFFGTTASEVSSHAATDNEGNSARFVADALKAWHCAGYNRMSLGLEQVLPGNGREITDFMYWESARWLASWSRLHDIPLRAGAVSAGRVTRTGVVTHKSLGAIGGGHMDPGPGFDMTHLIRLARGFKARQVDYLKTH